MFYLFHFAITNEIVFFLRIGISELISDTNNIMNIMTVKLKKYGFVLLHLLRHAAPVAFLRIAGFAADLSSVVLCLLPIVVFETCRCRCGNVQTCRAKAQLS